MQTRYINMMGQTENSGKEPVWFFVSKTDKKKKRSTKIKEETREKEEKYILCKQCENKITLPENKFEVGGEFEHTFLNPGGQVFRIGCFKSAEGCIALGVPTAEWTWFEGFEWQPSLCNQCNTHLGWFYRSLYDHNFFGLILDLLK
ncbi:hypothetical protein KJ966_17160 [bacterium]|nr:hypothetical protein [bacterium]